MRQAQITRQTGETRVEIKLEIDGQGRGIISSGSGFFDHMMELLAHHSGMDITLECDGDTRVDFHHSAEDIGITLGQAMDKALGDRGGIARYGSFLLPMDEALALVALDISGRAYLGWQVALPTARVGEFDTELVQEFFMALCRTLGLTLHVRMLEGTNCHHIIEAVFKGFGRALRQAAAIDPALGGKVPSSKGLLREETP